MGTIRPRCPGGGVEPTDNDFDWDAVDRMITSANAHDTGGARRDQPSTPHGRRCPGIHHAGEPADLVAFGFVTAVAQHYQADSSTLCGTSPPRRLPWAPTPNAARYTALLKVAYTGHQEGRPERRQSPARGSQQMELWRPAINPVTFLSQM